MMGSRRHSDQIGNVVHQALAGKYPVSDDFLREKVIQPLLLSLSRLPVNDLPDAIDSLANVQEDAHNQIVTLYRLDKDWAHRPVANIDLTDMHRAIYGIGQGSSIRTAEYVADFDGVPPTPLSKLAEKRAEIDAELHNLDALQNVSLRMKCDFLASLYAAIIGAHIFADGNGRVARIAAQYCLRRWGMDFVPLPKVRNAAHWHKALHKAIAGNIIEFSAYMSRLVKGEMVTEIEQSLQSPPEC